MRAVLLSKPQTLEWAEIAPPNLPEGWVRIRMRYVGICGSDIHYYVVGRIGDQIVEYPHILGHEGAGEVLDGAGRFDAGTRVYIEPAKTCGHCDQCLAGRENTCRNISFLGNPGESNGCMAEEIVMPPECVIPLPDAVGLEEAVLLEPLCIAVYAVDRSGMSPDARVAVVGAGPIGLTVLLALLEKQPKEILVSEPIGPRRRAAQALGAAATYDPGDDGACEAICDASEGGVEVAFDCAGSEESIHDTARMLRPGGTLVLIGIPEGDGFVKYDQTLFRRSEITIVNIRRQNKAISRTLGLLERRIAAARLLITHRFRPEQATEAFELVRRRADGAVKALLHF